MQIKIVYSSILVHNRFSYMYIQVQDALLPLIKAHQELVEDLQRFVYRLMPAPRWVLVWVWVVSECGGELVEVLVGELVRVIWWVVGGGG